MTDLRFTKPLLPDSTLTFIGERVQTVAPSFGSLVGLPIVHDWGPLGSDPKSAGGGAQLITSFAQFEAIFGSGDTAGRDAALAAFNGMGGGGGGAGGIYVYRAAVAAAAKAAVVIPKTGGGAALTLTAKYTGVAGDDISYVVEDDPITAANDRLRLLFRGATVETYSYPETDITALAAQIDALSKYVEPSGVTTGTILIHNSQAGTPLAGGNNGDVLDANAWQASLDALAYANFGLFAPFNLTDPTIKALILAWLREMAADMRPVRAIFGGAAGESLATATTDAAALRDPHVVRLGLGTYHDDLLDKDVSTAQLAPRLAGVAAARGLRSALTGAELSGLSVLSGPSYQERVAARDQGITTFAPVSGVDAEVAVAQGVTTFIDKTVDAMPYALWSEPRIVGLFDYCVRRMTDYGRRSVIGDLPVTQDTRDAVAKELSKLLDFLVGEQLATPNTTAFEVINTDDDPTLDDAVPYWFKFRPTRTANYLLGQAKVY